MGGWLDPAATATGCQTRQVPGGACCAKECMEDGAGTVTGGASVKAPCCCCKCEGVDCMCGLVPDETAAEHEAVWESEGVGMDSARLAMPGSICVKLNLT